MADDLEVVHHPGEDPEEAGGPVKTFLEHLEDLRWTLVRCAVAIFLGFVVCLGGAREIIEFLKWPLVQAEKIRQTQDPTVVISLGTNVFHRALAKNFPLVPSDTTNATTYFRMVPVRIDAGQIPAMPEGGFVMSLQSDTNPPPAAKKSIHVDLTVLGPVESFALMMQIAIFGGITVAAPFVLFFIGQFVLPALHVHEKRFLYKAAGIATFLFLLGVAFCYLLILVICLSTTVAFANWLGFTSEIWRADSYISFVCWFMLGTGISFELPLVLLSLVKIGILDHKKLAGFRAYFVVAGLTISGFITPDGNPLTMLMLYVPLHILYEISVVIAYVWYRNDLKASAAMGAK